MHLYQSSIVFVVTINPIALIVGEHAHRKSILNDVPLNKIEYGLGQSGQSMSLRTPTNRVLDIVQADAESVKIINRAFNTTEHDLLKKPHLNDTLETDVRNWFPIVHKCRPKLMGINFVVARKEPEVPKDIARFFVSRERIQYPDYGLTIITDLNDVELEDGSQEQRYITEFNFQIEPFTGTEDMIADYVKKMKKFLRQRKKLFNNMMEYLK